MTTAAREISKLENNRPLLRRRLLQLHFDAKVGHLGGNLSCLDIMATLFSVMNWQQDQFVLSKGHSAGALYTALWSVGRMSEDELRTFHQDDSVIGGHPSALFKSEIPFFTGSLGHGLGLATGLALAKKLQKKSGQVYVLLSDGEWQEGSTWEALHFAQHHGLSNLTVLVDFNLLQGFGRVDEVMSMQDLPERIAAMGIQSQRCPGHQLGRIYDAFSKPTKSFEVVFFETKKGHGISFMEDRVDWHYWTMSEVQYQQALGEVDSQLSRLQKAGS